MKPKWKLLATTISEEITTPRVGYLYTGVGVWKTTVYNYTNLVNILTSFPVLNFTPTFNRKIYHAKTVEKNFETHPGTFLVSFSKVRRHLQTFRLEIDEFRLENTILRSETVKKPSE